MAKIYTRYGDGTPAELSADELMQDLEAGTADAADRGKIPPLSKEELKHLFDIFASPCKFVSVDRGKEVVLSSDAATLIHASCSLVVPNSCMWRDADRA